jgi:D-glycero-D-manno-heptose 1,7-bisphosphate phosphatase
MKAVFLDRDGTINLDKDYVHRIEDFELLPGALESLKRIQVAGFALIIVTNQSGVGRGYYTEDDYHSVTAHMKSELAKNGVRLGGIYACFHHADGHQPYRLACGCRKPQPGMVMQAQKELGIDLPTSFVVGDKWTDIKMGMNAGIPKQHCILVRTGKASGEGEPVSGAVIVDDLRAAADYILRQ